MPLCSCSLRFAACSLARRPRLSIPSIHPRLPLSSLPWQRRNSTGYQHIKSLPDHNADNIEDEGARGWFEYFDAVLEEEPPERAQVFPPRGPPAENTASYQLGSSSVADRQHGALSIKAGYEVRGTGRKRPEQAPAYPPHATSAESTAFRRAKISPIASGQHFDLSIKMAHAAYGPAHARPLLNRKQTRKLKVRRMPSYLTPDERAELAKNRLMRLDAHVRPRQIRLRSSERPSLFYSRLWHTNFAKISRPYDKLLKDQFLQPMTAPVLHTAAAGWARSTLDQLDGTTGTLALGPPRDEPVQGGGISDRWTQIALWLLAYDKEHVIDFLLATHCEPFPPFPWIEDCLSLLARYYTHNDSNNVKESFERLINAFTVLAYRQTVRSVQQRQPRLERMSMSSSFLRLLLPHSSNEQVNEIYRTIKLHHVTVHYNTYHHISTWFAKNGHLEQGIDALLSAHETGSKVDSLQFRQNCSTLLRKTMQHPGGLRLSLRLVDNLVAMGVKLEGQLSTIIMLNAVEGGDPKTAFLVYRSMTRRGLPLAAHDHTILLRACKVNLEDINTLTEVIHGAVESGLVRTNPILATEILHCLALHHSQHNRTTVFTTVRDAYLELFSPHALQKFGLSLASAMEAATDPSTALLHDPSQHALTILIAAYLENATEADATRLYFRWRRLLEAGDKHAALLASTPHTGTIFLGRFTRSDETLHQAAQVIKDMQTPFPDLPHLTQAGPDVITWSVFLHGFARHGHTKLAHQVLTYMRNKGIEATKFTLNNLVAGCAGAQDLSRTMDALHEFSLVNEAFDEWTYKGLRRYRDQTELKKQMRDMEYAQQLDFTAEMRERLMEKISLQRPDDEPSAQPMFHKIPPGGVVDGRQWRAVRTERPAMSSADDGVVTLSSEGEIQVPWQSVKK